MKRRDFLKTLGAGAVAATLPLSLGAAEGARRPNVIVIYTDDQNIDQVGFYNDKILSPNIDRLAREGMRFSRAYVTSPVCTPSRYSLLTGQYASRSSFSGFVRNVPEGEHPNIGWNSNLNPGRKTIANVLKAAGYKTGMVGKWHLHTGPNPLGGKIAEGADPRDPKVKEQLKTLYDGQRAWVRKHYGFDYVESFHVQNVNGASQYLGIPKELAQQNVEWVTEGALRFIEENKDGPFFLYMPTTIPHVPTGSAKKDPRITPLGYLDRAPDVQPDRATIYERLRAAGIRPGYPGQADDILWLDDSIGVIMAKLAELGIDDNTCIVFMSDHQGPGKFSLYEDGARVPLFIRWPAAIKPDTESDAIVANVDILPTVAEICGAEVPTGHTVDGLSFAPTLRDPKETLGREALYLEISNTRGVVTADGWKYIAVRYGAKHRALIDQGKRLSHWGQDMETATHTFGVEKRHPGYFDGDQLYNLNEDPDEKRNLAGDPACAERLAVMKATLQKRMAPLPFQFSEFQEATR